MDPLSIVASSFGIVGAIAKASIAIFDFSQQVKDASEDLQGMGRELQALSAILDPLARNISRAAEGTVSAALSQQLASSLDGCALVVARIDTTLEKYKKDAAWTKARWAMFGRGDMEKLRASLEAYKMALSLGLHVISMAAEDSIKGDTGAIRTDTRALRHDTAAIQVNTEEILARVMSLGNGAKAEAGRWTRQWIDSMAVLSSYAESSYQDTIIDPSEEIGIALVSEVDKKIVCDEGAALGAGSGFDEEQPARGPRRTGSAGLNGNGTQEVTNSSPEILVSQTYAETDDTIGVTGVPLGDGRLEPRGRDEVAANYEARDFVPLIPFLDTSEISEESHESHQGLDEMSLDASSAIVQPNTKDGLDVVVAIDVGRTSAAVAWMAPNIPAQIIRKWPGGSGPRVPIKAEYDENGNVLRWGFSCGEGTGSRTAGSGHLYSLFLRQLYAYIRQTIISGLGLKLSDWAELGVEFHLTAPDLSRVLTQQELCQTLKELKNELRGSGIGTGGPRHCAVVSLTETEAAATAVLLELPVPNSPQHSIMLKIGLDHVTIVRAERSWTMTKIHPCSSIRTPELGPHIQETVSTWLQETNPDISERLRPYGLRNLVRDVEYDAIMDVLHGHAPLRESYSLRFDGLPKSFRSPQGHGNLRIENGMIKLNRAHLERILDSLAHRISSLVIDAFVEYSTGLQDTQLLQSPVALQTADTPKHLAKRVMKALEQKLSIASGGRDRTARPRNPAAVSDTSLHEGVMINPSPTTFRDRRLAAVRGLLLHRNAWNVTPGPSMGCDGLVSPQLYARARYSARSASTYRRDESKTDPWLHPMTTIKQHWRVSDSPFSLSYRKDFWLDLYFTLDNAWRETDPLELGRLTKLCTVHWELYPFHFRSPAGKRKWWGASVKLGTLDFSIQFSLLQPFKTGAAFTLQGSGTLSQAPKSIKWHSEPPFLVWPAEWEKG